MFSDHGKDVYLFPVKLGDCLHFTDEEVEAQRQSISPVGGHSQDVNSRLSGHLLSNAPLKVSATLSVCRVYQEHGLPQDTETFPGVGTKAAVSPVVIG